MYDSAVVLDKGLQSAHADKQLNFRKRRFQHLQKFTTRSAWSYMENHRPQFLLGMTNPSTGQKCSSGPLRATRACARGASYAVSDLCQLRGQR